MARVKAEGQDFMEWLSGLVESDPEAKAAYEDERARHTIIPRTKVMALEIVAKAAEQHLNAVDKHISQLELWRNKPIGSKAQALYDEDAKVLDAARGRLQDALAGLEFYEEAYGFEIDKEIEREKSDPRPTDR